MCVKENTVHSASSYKQNSLTCGFLAHYLILSNNPCRCYSACKLCTFSCGCRWWCWSCCTRPPTSATCGTCWCCCPRTATAPSIVWCTGRPSTISGRATRSCYVAGRGSKEINVRADRIGLAVFLVCCHAVTRSDWQMMRQSWERWNMDRVVTQRRKRKLGWCSCIQFECWTREYWECQRNETRTMTYD